MVQADPRPLSIDPETRTAVVGYEDFEILETGDVDVFVLNVNELRGLPPFYVEVDGRRFGLQRDTFQVRGHGALLPAWIREQEAAGRLVLLAERRERFLVYVHDPSATDEDDEGGDEE
ncbi:MAG: hypothetical protein FJZ92_13305 [Chloroflexi bacterium]|nr:hypothetical protein [Chloroflexota bacterium]